MAKLSVVSIGKLGEYDELLKGYIADEIESAVDALDTDSDVTIASQSGDVVTIKAGISETDGVIGAGSGSDITLAAVATTGDAEDVAYDNTTSGLTATDAQAAIDELAAASAGGVESKTIYMTDNTSVSGTDYAAIYKIYQGAEGSSAEPEQSELIGTINIPKDQFVDDAELVDITYSEGHLYDGSTDVTELIKGEGGTATEADAGKYAKLVFEIVSGSAGKDTIYVSVKELSHVYTGGTNAEVTVSINASTDVITATIGDIAATKITYIAEDQSQSIARESVGAALTRLDGSDSTTGSVAKKVKDAIGALDTSNDVVIASVSNDIVTLKAGVKEENGIIAQGTGSDIVLAKVAKTGAAADVSYSNTIAGTSVTDADSAIDALVTLVGDGVEECTTAQIEALFPTT